MIDLNALRIFDSVASLRNFSAAARELGLPKSSVSRSIAMLEAELGTRLLQRTTREVVLTDPGAALKDRGKEILARISETLDYIGSLGTAPRGLLKVSAGIGIGLNVLAELVPQFLERYPEVDIAVDLTSRTVDLVAANVDVAIRMVRCLTRNSLRRDSARSHVTCVLHRRTSPGEDSPVRWRNYMAMTLWRCLV